MAYRYGKISGNVKTNYTIVYAPRKMSINECKLNGYKKIIDDKPQPSPGHMVNPDHIEEDEESFKIIYIQVEIPHIEPTFICSKYKLIAKLMEMNLWAQVKQMLENNGLLDLFNAAQELNSDDQFFKQGIQLAKQELGVTDEQIQQVIEETQA